MIMKEHNPTRGRGSSFNPANRFQPTHMEYEIDEQTGLPPKPQTTYIRDASKNIVAENNSPDIPFDHSINPYRGCEHGCIYCYARQTHEYLGYSSGMDFESKIIVKHDAPDLLRERLSKRSWQPETLVMSGVTDPYQPVERELELTRSCLKVLAGYRNPVSIITKNYLVTRDIDILSDMAGWNGVRVAVSVTTLDRELARTMEPRTSSPDRRLKAIEQLSAAGIPVSAMIAPIIPGLTDHEVPELLQAVADAGAQNAGYTIIRLPYANKELFKQWLEHHYPNKSDKVLHRIQSLRGGRLNASEFGERMRGKGEFGAQIRQLFHIHKEKVGLNQSIEPLNTTAFRRGGPDQLQLFG
jgi:DNA repair photolyase